MNSNRLSGVTKMAKERFMMRMRCAWSIGDQQTALLALEMGLNGCSSGYAIGRGVNTSSEGRSIMSPPEGGATCHGRINY